MCLFPCESGGGGGGDGAVPLAEVAAHDNTTTTATQRGKEARGQGGGKEEEASQDKTTTTAFLRHVAVCCAFLLKSARDPQLGHSAMKHIGSACNLMIELVYDVRVDPGCTFKEFRNLRCSQFMDTATDAWNIAALKRSSCFLERGVLDEMLAFVAWLCRKDEHMQMLGNRDRDKAGGDNGEEDRTRSCRSNKNDGTRSVEDGSFDYGITPPTSKYVTRSPGPLLFLRIDPSFQLVLFLLLRVGPFFLTSVFLKASKATKVSEVEHQVQRLAWKCHEDFEVSEP